MSNSILQSYRQGFQVLNHNLYLFWVNLAYVLPIPYIFSATRTQDSWILILIPFVVITLKLAEVQLLFEQPQKSLKIMETFVIVLYKYFLRVFFLCVGATTLGLIIFALNGGNFQTLLTYLETFSSPQATLLQKLIFTLPITIISPIIPFFNIFWVVKKQSFFRSISSGIMYAYKHLPFSLTLPLVSILAMIIQHPILRYLNQSNTPVITVLNIYLGLIMLSASVDYLKNPTNKRDQL